MRVSRRTGAGAGVAAAVAAFALVLSGCSSSGSNAPSNNAGGGNGSGGKGSGSTVSWPTAQSAAAGGGMNALVAAAKKEGTLNVIALPPSWANYAAIIAAFKQKYGIQIKDENPDGSSGDELNALKSTKGQASAPDVVDVGNAYALQGAQSGMFAPYKVQTWNDIPQGQKDSGGLWYSDYGGYISIGCNESKIKNCPKTMKALDNPSFHNAVALNGNPTSANAAFNGVWAAALANGGSVSNIQPGIDFFHKLNQQGIFNKTDETPATVASGATPIAIDWDYLNAGETQPLAKKGVKWEVTVPSDGLVSGFYAQAININAPHPAAARLWEEFLYSQAADGGQNLWLKGYARPIELPAMIKNGSADKTAVKKIPPVHDTHPFLPTQAQITQAQKVVTQKWSAAVS